MVQNSPPIVPCGIKTPTEPTLTLNFIFSPPHLSVRRLQTTQAERDGATPPLPISILLLEQSTISQPPPCSPLPIHGARAHAVDAGAWLGQGHSARCRRRVWSYRSATTARFLLKISGQHCGSQKEWQWQPLIQYRHENNDFCYIWNYGCKLS